MHHLTFLFVPIIITTDTGSRRPKINVNIGCNHTLAQISYMAVFSGEDQLKKRPPPKVFEWWESLIHAHAALAGWEFKTWQACCCLVMGTKLWKLWQKAVWNQRAVHYITSHYITHIQPSQNQVLQKRDLHSGSTQAKLLINWSYWGWKIQNTMWTIRHAVMKRIVQKNIVCCKQQTPSADFLT